ncbi:hypothetical protein PVAND_000114 [Polypedilum vanderplanki]|uniref:Bestrophin homolog n=1 Tax=Polypedilum vanderplanki TaxID=319348 RepID=A0A9J6BJ28_POLVA|nr:hypothetical protein PVAND_000114 [Polypedilum vanderplanki]
MTVSYAEDLLSASGMSLIKLVFLKWKGSLFKLIWKDLLMFISMFYILQGIYVFGISEENKKYFEGLVYYVKEDVDKIPISFLLGFFVTNVMTRWWSQFQSIPSPAKVAVYVSASIHGNDEAGRVMRRTIMRYVNLSLVMVFRLLSPRVKTRYPKMEDLIEAGFITESELAVMKNIDQKYPSTSKSWLPLCWAASICNRARAEGRIKDDFALKTLTDELNNFRGNLGALMDFNEFCIPLVYVQVVTIAVYTFFFTTVIAKQPIIPEYNEKYKETQFLDHLPFLITLQFIFYIGWLKVAETMINPFGEDDDDFDVNSMIDSNLITSYLIVDDMHSQYPDLLRDRYWDALPRELPDIGKLDKNEKIKLTDFFDVVGTRKRKSRKSNLLIPLNEQDKKQLSSAFSSFNFSSQSNNITTVPNFGNIQTQAEKQLLKTKQRATTIKISELSSSDDD